LFGNKKKKERLERSCFGNSKNVVETVCVPQSRVAREINGTTEFFLPTTEARISALCFWSLLLHFTVLSLSDGLLTLDLMRSPRGSCCKIGKSAEVFKEFLNEEGTFRDLKACSLTLNIKNHLTP
jgi:hypothetical protein